MLEGGGAMRVHWKPVWEQLPEDGVWCLVSVKGDIDPYTTVAVYRSPVPVADYDGGWFTSDDTLLPVTAWDYLPLPFKEDDR